MTDSASGATPPVGHAMLLYGDRRERTATCASYIELGVATDSAILVAAPRPHWTDLSHYLPERGDDVRFAELTSQGSDPGRVLSMIRMFGREHGRRPTRYLQEVGWLGRPRDELLEAIRYESLTCAALTGSNADVLCCYDARLDSHILAAAMQVHPIIIQDSQRRVNTAFTDNADLTDDSWPKLSAPPDDACMLSFRCNQSEVRELTGTQARQAGLPPERVVDLVIAVGELAGNTMLHTDSAGKLTIWSTDEEFVCQVSDSGQIRDSLAGTLRPDPSEIGSRRGLWLVHQVSDLVQVRSGKSGTTVRIHFRRPVTPDPGARPYSAGLPAESICG